MSEKNARRSNAVKLYYSKSGSVEYIRYLDKMPGALLLDIWDDIPPTFNRQSMPRRMKRL